MRFVIATLLVLGAAAFRPNIQQIQHRGIAPRTLIQRHHDTNYPRRPVSFLRMSPGDEDVEALLAKAEELRKEGE